MIKGRVRKQKRDVQSQYFLDMVQERLMIEAFLLADVEINIRDNEGRNALYWAIRTSHKHNIDLLLKHGISLMVKPNHHALFHTIESNNLGTFALLLKVCKEINMLNNKGQTLLMTAIQQENSVMVQYLINHGIRLDTRDIYGFTALDYTKKSKNRMVFDLVYYATLSQESNKIA